MIAAAPPPAPAAIVRSLSPLRYDLRLRWLDARRTLVGTERVTFANAGASPLGAIWIRHWPNGWRPVGGAGGSAGCAHPIATLAVARGGTIGRRTAGCSAYRVDLASPVAPGGRGHVDLTFRVRVPIANDRFGVAGGVAYLGNAVPILAVHDRRGWHLERYSATGEAFYSLTAAWRATIVTSRDLTVAVTGRVSAKRGRTVADTPRARDLALAIGRFTIGRSRVGPIRLRVFAGPGTSPTQVARAVHWSRLALARYATWWGPYGAPELDVVTSRFTAFGGMEYPQIVFTDPFPAPIVHEVAHQWWYGLVGDDQYREPWLDESFASFAERALVPAGTCGDPPVPVIGRLHLDDSMRRFDPAPQAYGAVVYDGGACALAELEQGFGRDSFRAFLASYVAAHRDGVATTADFLAAVRAAAPPGLDVDRWKRRSRIASVG